MKPKYDDHSFSGVYLPLKKLNRFTHRHYDKMLLAQAQNSDMYQMAEKAIICSAIPYGGILALERPKKLSMFPQVEIKAAVGALGVQVKDSLGQMMLEHIARKDGVKPVMFKREISAAFVKKVVNFEPPTVGPCVDHQLWLDGEQDYLYYVCATSEGRVADMMKKPGWEHRIEYQDYVDRKTFSAELGRYKVSDGLYVVFVGCISDKSQYALMWGNEVPFSCTPIENNLRTVFTARPVADGLKPYTGPENSLMATNRITYGDGMLVHWRMKFAADADMSKCVLMQAERPLVKA